MKPAGARVVEQFRSAFENLRDLDSQDDADVILTAVIAELRALQTGLDADLRTIARDRIVREP